MVTRIATVSMLAFLAAPGFAAKATVDFGRVLREWDGFGVNYVETSQTRNYDEWSQDYGGMGTLSEDERREIIRLIFGDDGLKPGLAKMFIDPFHEGETEADNDNADPYSIDLGGYTHERTTENMRYFVREGLKPTRARGDDLTIIATLYGPAPWMTKQNMVRGRDLDPKHKMELGEYIAAFAKFMREREGFPVKYVSLHNEGTHPIRHNPDGRDGENLHRHDFNLLWSPEGIAETVCSLREILDRNGMGDVGISPGECTNWHWMRRVSEALVANECAMRNLGLITSHGFAGSGDPSSNWYSGTAFDPVPIRLLQAKRPELRVWTTSSSWGKMDVHFVEHIRGHIYGNRHNGFIPWAAVQRHSQWVGGDPNPGCAVRVDDEGGYEIRPGYYLYKQVARAGQPGMGVAAVSSDDPYLGIIAFAANGTENPAAFVVVNSAWFPIEAEIDVVGTMADRFEVYRTIVDTFPDPFWTAEQPAEEFYLKHADAESVDGAVRYTAPPLSVTTFFEKPAAE